MARPKSQSGKYSNRKLAAGFSGAIKSLGKAAMKKLAEQGVQKVVKATAAKKRRKRTMKDTDYTYAGKFDVSRKENLFQQYTKKGCVTTQEIGTVVTGQNATIPIYVGHATHGNVRLMMRTFWRAVVKDIFKLHGILVQNMETESPGTTGDIVITYQTSASGETPLTIIQTITGNTFNQIAGGLDTAWVTVFSGSGAVPTQNARVQILLTEVSFVRDNVTLSKRDYTNAYIDVFCKTDLKIQNRTVATGTDEDANSTENVANQPLHGKSYMTKGNGLYVRTKTGGEQGKSLICAEDTGLLAYTNNLNQLWLREPPLPTLFTPLPKLSRASLQPGTIKTSTLMKKVVMKLTDFWQVIAFPGVIPSGSAKGVILQNRYGDCRIFAMEKIICATNTDTVPIAGVELNNRMGVLLKFERPTDTAEVVEGQSFVTAQG